MKTLLLMRHAKSDRSLGELPDIERPLNKRGRKASLALAEHLRAHDLVPDFALVSAARRTQETWNRMAETLGEPPLEVRRELYLAEPQEILGVINGIGEFSRVLLLGHNPGVEQAASLLTAPRQAPPVKRHLPFQAKFPTGGIAVLRFADIPWSEVRFGIGELLDFITPKSMTD
ncbi:MAG: histidine phosphatase family protein [Alphaproteobacteria bacterium]